MPSYKNMTILYVIAAIGYGSLAIEVDRARGHYNRPVVYVTVGAIWPLMALITVSAQLFGLKLPDKRP